MSTKEQQERLAVIADAKAATQAIRGGHQRSFEGEHAEPIFATSSYVFENAQTAARRFAGEEPGNVYSRYTNPTVRIFEERICALEGGEHAVATSSGMAAIMSTCMALLSAGDHIVCSRSVFGATIVLLNKFLEKFGVSTTYVAPTDLSAWRSAIQDNTRMLFFESPSNPLCEIADITSLSSLAHENGALLVIDNCFCTPALQKPFDFGADIVIHSATKYLDGQGRCLGGVVIGEEEQMSEVQSFLRTAGPTMSPFNAWVFLKGLETLCLRMQAHSTAALDIAEWLQSQQGVEQVFYAGLPDHIGHLIAKRQQSAFGGVLSFRIKGDLEAAWRFIDATRLMSITANLGDAKTTIIHPASTTHGRLSAEERILSGVSDNLIRIAVGLEAVDDLKMDIERGLKAM